MGTFLPPVEIIFMYLTRVKYVYPDLNIYTPIEIDIPLFNYSCLGGINSHAGLNISTLWKYFHNVEFEPTESDTI